jgi:hypothetical protein
VTLLTQAMKQTMATEMIDLQVLYLLSLGEAQLRGGLREEARAVAERALAHARARQERGYQAYARRLLLPLTVAAEPSGHGGGGMLKIARQPQGYTAYFISRVGNFPCIGARDPEANAQLQEAFRCPAWKTVQSLRRDPHAPTETCWLHQQECCLSTTALPRDGRCRGMARLGSRSTDDGMSETTSPAIHRGRGQVKGEAGVACRMGSCHPPGAGQSRLARCCTNVVPAMPLAHALATTRIHLVAGRTGAPTALMTRESARTPWSTYLVSDKPSLTLRGCHPLMKLRPPTDGPKMASK